jgi:DNA-binding NtrC family response regulator
MMNELIKFAESLVSPTKVCVIDAEEEVCFQIEDALSVYNCCVRCSYDATSGCTCLRKGVKCSADLIFLGDNVSHYLDVIKHAEAEHPDASIVILTRDPSSPKVAEIMRNGVYTFLVKNGSFSTKNVRNIFRQLNLRIHATDVGAVSEVKVEPQPA